MRWTPHAVVAALCLVLVGGCSSHRENLDKPNNQLRVGVDAARINLWREALFRFRRAADMDPKNAQVLNNLAVAYEGNGEFEKARETYIEALKLDRSNQYIQKNYSRFVEFYSKNRGKKVDEPAAKKARSATDKAPATIPTEPPVPSDEHAPPEPPVTTPAGTKQPGGGR